MAPIIQNLAMLLLPISSIWSMPTAAFPLLNGSSIAANVSTTNMTMKSSYKDHLKNEPPLLPDAFTGNDSMTCEPTPSDCAQTNGEECRREWYWDVHKSHVFISAKAFCEEVATTLDGLQAPVGKHYNIVDGGAIADSYKSAYGVFGIGVEDSKECDTNEGFRYPSHPVSGYDWRIGGGAVSEVQHQAGQTLGSRYEVVAKDPRRRDMTIGGICLDGRVGT
ncbi:hypothetical protein G7Y79_00004g014020 [Physcia stellaris]|nr:hypothetical protein G7Y79_00004g014020 [Physcia stellaris]